MFRGSGPVRWFPLVRGAPGANGFRTACLATLAVFCSTSNGCAHGGALNAYSMSRFARELQSPSTRIGITSFYLTNPGLASR